MRAPHTFLLVAAALAAGCSNSSSAPAVTATQVVGSTPADGAIDVEPDAVITVQLRLPPGGLGPDDVTVHDGANRLPGALARVGATDTWTFLPDDELPRGNRVEVRTQDQGVVASFTVREATWTAREYPGSIATAVFSWPNGRRAVQRQVGLYELVDDELVSSPLGYAEPSAATVGDGDFVYVAYDPFQGVNQCVRANLDGAVDRVPTPRNRPLGAVNSRGDVVVFVSTQHGGPNDWGLWRLRRDEVAFERVGAIEIAEEVRPAIDDDGVTSIAYAEFGALWVARFPDGDLVGERSQLGTSPGRISYNSRGDGAGLVAWTRGVGTPGGIDYQVALARFEPGEGLTMLTDGVTGWSFTGAGSVMALDGLFAAGGASFLPFRVQFGGPGPGLLTNEFVRVAPDGSISAPEFYAASLLLGPALASTTLQYETRVTPRRAEMWTMTDDSTDENLLLRRSRPGEPFEEERVVHTAQPGNVITSFDYVVDDAGRGVLVVNEVGAMLQVFVVTIE